MPRQTIFLAIVILLLSYDRAWSQDEIESELKALANVIPKENKADQLRDHARQRLQTFVEKENAAWANVRTQKQWEQFRDDRIAKLKATLGTWPEKKAPLKVMTTKEIVGNGYRIKNIVFQSRPGLLVTANLYLPEKTPQSMPGILLVHSHHNPKHQSELQDMGITWAKQGCAVLVMDLLGHGERRQHPFVNAQSYTKSFRVGRQDYYFRYNTGCQLSVIGDTLIGWFVWDLMRGVDLLLELPNIDSQRIMVFGAVAGGGDPAGVMAALDSRVSAVAAFNFGGPQPDYRIPENAERDFYYFGVPYWESTRCIRNGAKDGFAHWVIVSAVAPRRLIYCHEFDWNEKKDPVWPRIKKVFSFYDKSDHVGVAMGQGTLQGSPPESSHCNNIGPLHRSRIYPHLLRWFGLAIPEKDRAEKHYSRDELNCMTDKIVKEIGFPKAHKLAHTSAESQIRAMKSRLTPLLPAKRKEILRREWNTILGDIATMQSAKVLSKKETSGRSMNVQSVTLETTPGIVLPVTMLLPKVEKKNLPIVVMISQQGQHGLLRNRTKEISQLLDRGVAVCLPDLRGMGSLAIGDSRGFRSSSTTFSAREQMLGQTVVGAQVQDLRQALGYLRKEFSSAKIALWAESFAATNGRNTNVEVPLDADQQPQMGEPGPAIVVLLTALFDDGLSAVHVSGSLPSYQSLLESPFFHVPHDAIIPGATKVGDLPMLMANLAPLPLSFTNGIDGRNRRIGSKDLKQTLAIVTNAYAESGQDNWRLNNIGSTVNWMIDILQRKR